MNKSIENLLKFTENWVKTLTVICKKYREIDQKLRLTFNGLVIIEQKYEKIIENHRKFGKKLVVNS